MAGHGVCPWWIGWFLASPFRRLVLDPAPIVAPYVRAGMTVLEPGPGMGFFMLELARLAGHSGRVVAVDVQPRMIAWLRRRARRAGLADRIAAHAGLAVVSHPPIRSCRTALLRRLEGAPGSGERNTVWFR